MIRQRSFGEILDASVEALRVNLAALVALALPCHVIPSVVTDLLTFGGARDDGLDLLVDTLLTGVPGFYASVGAVYVVMANVRGERLTPKAALAAPLGHLSRIFFGGLLVNALLVAGYLAFVVPGIYLTLGLFLVAPVLAVERSPVLPMLSRSWRLMRGAKLRALGILFTLAVAAIAFDIGVLIVGVEGSLPVIVASALVYGLCFVLVDLAAIFLYFDVRVRREAFDLEHLAGEVERDPTAAGVR